MEWRKINGRTPKEKVIWLGGYYKRRWCTFLVMDKQEYPKWATYWIYCYAPKTTPPHE